MRYLNGATGALLLLWCTAALAAATEPFGHQLGQIPLTAYLLVIPLAGVPGVWNVLGMLQRGEIEPGPKAWIKVVRELLGSLIGGFVIFFLCEGAKLMTFPVPDVLQVLNIAAGGYGGARFVDRFLSKRADQLVESGVKAPGT